MTKADFVQARQFALTDIAREITLARATNTCTGRAELERLGVIPGSGNFLAALGLLCYTEFGGRLKFGLSKSSENFNRFFDELGADYAAFRQQHNVYDVFRCGLAHEYYVKRSCTIAALSNGESAGVVVQMDGSYCFVVERYYQDLNQALCRLEVELFSQ